MIPKALLATFLSIKITTDTSTLPPADQDVARGQPVNVESSFDVPVIQSFETADKAYDQLAPENVDQEQQQPMTIEVPNHEISTQARGSFPFDQIPFGEYDASKSYDGVRIVCDSPSAWIWSLPDAFPNIRPSHGGRRALGPYPAGFTFSIIFDKPAVDATYSIGWVVNGQLGGGTFTTALYLGSTYSGGGGGTWPNNAWNTRNSGQIKRFDRIVVNTTMGSVSGVLLIDHLTYLYE